MTIKGLFVTVASITHANSHTYQMKAGQLSSLMKEEPFAEVSEREERRGTESLHGSGYKRCAQLRSACRKASGPRPRLEI